MSDANVKVGAVVTRLGHDAAAHMTVVTIEPDGQAAWCCAVDPVRWAGESWGPDRLTVPTDQLSVVGSEPAAVSSRSSRSFGREPESTP